MRERNMKNSEKAAAGLAGIGCAPILVVLAIAGIAIIVAAVTR